MTAISKDEEVLEAATADLSRVAQANASISSDDSVWDGQASHCFNVALLNRPQSGSGKKVTECTGSGRESSFRDPFGSASC